MDHRTRLLNTVREREARGRPVPYGTPVSTLLELESEGLVRREDRGRRPSVYLMTEAGLRALRAPA